MNTTRSSELLRATSEVSEEFNQGCFDTYGGVLSWGHDTPKREVPLIRTYVAEDQSCIDVVADSQGIFANCFFDDSEEYSLDLKFRNQASARIFMDGLPSKMSIDLLLTLGFTSIG